VSAISVICGVVIVLLVAVDIGLTVLHPTIPGPISHRVTRATWRVVRRSAVVLRARRVLSFGGPLATISLLLWWLAGFWIGFALIYLPYMPRFSASVHFGHQSVFDALYASATMLTTLGLGDLLPTQDGMRIAVVCQAATGVGTVSAAISYILSLYPLAAQNRAHALYLSDLHLRDPEAAAQYLEAAGDSGIAEIHQRLIDGHQSLRRFPVLYYFHPEREAESVHRLLESAAVLCAIARWSPPAALTRYGQRLAEALRSTLARIADDYEERFIGGRSGQTRTGRPSSDEAARILARLRPDRPSGVPSSSSEVDAFGDYLAKMNHLLAGIARAHLYSSEPLAARLTRTSAAPAAATSAAGASRS
jgi:hypothetical protein